MTLPVLPDCCALSEPTAVVLGCDDGAMLLAVRGEIDMDNADHLSHLLAAAMAGPPRHVTVDASEVTFLGAAGIRALLEARRQAATTGHRLVIDRPHPAVHRVLQWAGVLDAFALTTLEPAAGAPPLG